MSADEAGQGRLEVVKPVEVFIAHHPKDEDFLRELEASLAVLQREGKIRLFSLRDVALGKETEAVVTERLNAAALVVLLVSPDFLASDACIRDAHHALDRGAPGHARVIPIPVRACDWERDRIGVLAPLPKKGGPIAGWARRDDAWLEVVSGLRPVIDELLPGPGSSAASQSQQKPGPFPGLEPFDEDLAPYFFGREAEIAEALAMLGDTPSGHRRWLQIEGPSGTGKSSLARAGLIPSVLRRPGIRGAPSTFLRAALRPGRDPVLSLAHAVFRALRDHLPSARTLGAVVADFRASDTALASLLRERVPEGSGFLLLVDQLEEALTFAESAADTLCFDALLAGALADKGGPLYLVTTVRTDYVDRFESLPALETRLNAEASRYHLRAITPEGLRAAIERPAERARLEWDDDLPDQIVEDAAASKGSLPLVAHVLWALNEERERRGGRRLSLKAYRKLKGVGGALAKSADALLKSLGDSGRERAKRLLVRLVRVGLRGEEDRRGSMLWSDAVEVAGGDTEAERVLLRVSGFRDPDKPEGSRSAPPRLVAVVETVGEAQVSLIHDALLTRWPLLQALVNEKRKGLTCCDELEATVRGWEAAGKPLDGLPRGDQLEYFRGAEGPSAAARRYLELAGARELKAKRRLRWTIGGLAVGLLAFAGIALFAVVQRAESERQRQLAESRLRDAVDVADEVAFVIDQRLEVIGGAGPVRKELLERVSKLQERLLEGASESPEVLRSRMVVHGQRGSVALTHDDLALARREYEAALAIARKLSEANPSDAGRMRDLSVSYEKLGDVAKAGGDLAGARGFFEKCLELIQAQAEADPSDMGLKHDLLVTYDRLGDVAKAGGDLTGARGFFDKGLELTKALLEVDPSNARLKQDLSVSYDRLGDVAKAGGDLTGARGFFDKGLELTKALLEADPSSVRLKLNLSVSYERLGDVAQLGGDFAGARGFFEKSFELRKTLSGADPSNAGLKRALSMSYLKFGEVAQAGGDFAGARGFFEKSLEMRKALSEADPLNAGLEIDLVVSHGKLASCALDARDIPAARTHHAEATAVLNRLDQSGRSKGNARAGELRAVLKAMEADLSKK
jgi:tetratricopeptide (TPR) repeat protein